MKILEIIHLRMAGDGSDGLAAKIRQALEGWEENGQISLYRHGRLGSDLMIHLERSNQEGNSEASDLGTQLASVLRAYGIVEHSVWLEAE